MDIVKDNQMYMRIAQIAAERSYAKRLKVGCVAKLAENGYSSKDAAIFITHSPCIHCALLIQKCGISQVFYHELYRSREGLDFLERAGIKVTQL